MLTVVRAGAAWPSRSKLRRRLVLVVLIVVPRWAYLSTLENTEPRYMVEIFPFLRVFGGIMLVGGRTKTEGQEIFTPPNAST